MVLNREQELLSVLSAEEKTKLTEIIEKLTFKSIEITARSKQESNIDY
jgi:hypothetical protein